MIEIGTQVLVVVGNLSRNGDSYALRVEVVESPALFGDPAGSFKWRSLPTAASDPLAVPRIGYCDLVNEGVTWARGWDAETEGALLAAWALTEPTPTPDTTTVGFGGHQLGAASTVGFGGRVLARARGVKGEL